MKRNCSDETFFAERRAEYKGYLLNQGLSSKLVKDQFSKASAIFRNDLLRTRGKEAKKLFPFVITFNPNLPDVGNIVRKHLFILQSNPKLKELFSRGSVIPAFRRSKNLKELLAPFRFKLAEEGQIVIITMVVLNAIEIDATFVEISSWNLNHFQVFRRAKNTPFILDSLVIQKMLFIWPHARNVACNMWGPPPLISE